MRPIYVACLSLTLGLGFTPALTSAQEEPLVEQQPNPDSEITPHVTDVTTDGGQKTNLGDREAASEKSEVCLCDFPREPGV
jgi:hypothetical protein